MRKDWLHHPLAPFALTTLAPVPFLILGSVFGAVWLLPAFLWLTVIKLWLDRAMTGPDARPGWPGPARRHRPAPDQPGAAKPDGDLSDAPADTPADTPDTLVADMVMTARAGRAFAPLSPQPERGARRRLRGWSGNIDAGDRLLIVLGLTHFIVLGFGIHGLAGGAGFGPIGWLIAFFAYGIWIGQVSNAAAHELIHRRAAPLRALGSAIYVTLLYGHHSSAHRLVHHRFVATDDDPNTAALGESFYSFATRAWSGAFIAGYEMEDTLRKARKGRGMLARLHPYVVHLIGSALTALIVLFSFGFGGWFVWLLICAYAQLQILLADYVQHYGLLRRTLPDGRLEPVGPRHAWNAPQVVSAWLTLNAPFHADHHSHPGRVYPDLSADPQGRDLPPLPHSLPVMGAIALVPPRWRRLMDKRVAAARKGVQAGL